jgi:hypothetical protein
MQTVESETRRTSVFTSRQWTPVLTAAGVANADNSTPRVEERK